MSSTKQIKAACGTDGGYRRHLRRGESTCEPCREAHRLDTAARRRAANPEMRPYLAIEHGTAAGYRSEVRRGVTPCDPCRLAHNRARAESKRAQAARREELEEYRDAVLVMRADLAPLIQESNASTHKEIRLASTSAMAAIVQLQVAVAALINAHHVHPRRNS